MIGIPPVNLEDVGSRSDGYFITRSPSLSRNVSSP
jgi:hypothetical protein